MAAAAAAVAVAAMAAAGMRPTTTAVAGVGTRPAAAWDINPSPIPVIPTPTTKPKLPTTKPKLRTSISTKPKPFSVPDLLAAKKTIPEDELYLGFERWLPTPPQVKSPRSIYNAASLAYIGDCIYELYARRHFLFPPLSLDNYNARVMEVVRCEAQDALLKKLLEDSFLSDEERDVLRWGKNIGSGKTRTKKRAGVAVYSRASSLETLIGFLYLTNIERLEDVMLKLGFSTGASKEWILQQLNKD